MDCTDCGRTCASVRDLENHRRQEHCVASCHLCGKPFFSQNHLSVHLKQVHDIGQKEDGKFSCLMCNDESTLYYISIMYIVMIFSIS